MFAQKAQSESEDSISLQLTASLEIREEMEEIIKNRAESYTGGTATKGKDHPANRGRNVDFPFSHR